MNRISLNINHNYSIKQLLSNQKTVNSKKVLYEINLINRISLSINHNYSIKQLLSNQKTVNSKKVLYLLTKNCIRVYI